MPSDKRTPKRCPKTGRILKGSSGNYKGRPTKSDMTPHDLSKAVLAASSFIVDVKDQDGQPQRLPALEVILRQLAINAVKGDRASARLYMQYVNNAVQAAEARAKQRYERLGEYLKSVDSGAPWKLDPAEASFYQSLADELGIPIVISANGNDEPDMLTSADIDAIIATPTVWKSVTQQQALGTHVQRELVRRIIYAYQARLDLGKHR